MFLSPHPEKVEITIIIFTSKISLDDALSPLPAIKYSLIDWGDEALKIGLYILSTLYAFNNIWLCHCGGGGVTSVSFESDFKKPPLQPELLRQSQTK